MISGTVVDDAGAGIAGARVALAHEGISPGTDVRSREDGQFFFSNVLPGPYRLTVSAPGFADRALSGALDSGEVSTLLPIRLTLAVGDVAVDVTPTRMERAERQIKAQERQRLLGVLPNFFVTYDADALPLSAKQKFELSWKSRFDPVQFGVVGLTAGVQQARNDYSAFGQGAAGFARRYAAAYGNV
ncbi:MAG TPA: carboxypeptidase-like regulatory domain-containing protein, partial [Vicinamibacterales bacterium]|nr:carboxypeptidase-like regulatory domain-containing protein [Vicinamibacterales bacterium]